MSITAVINRGRTFVPPPPYRRPPAETTEDELIVFLRKIAQDTKRPRTLRANAASLAEQLEAVIQRAKRKKTKS